MTFFVNSGETLCFSAASFDLVFFGYALHHQEGSVALAEARRVLRTGGEILIIEPTVESEYTQLVAVFQKEEPDLLTKAQDAIQASSHAIVRRETFVVHHFFDTQKAFLDHYVTSYAGGPASQDERQALLDIIGKKRFEKTICVEDECSITLLSGNQQPRGDSRAHAGRTACS